MSEGVFEKGIDIGIATVQTVLKRWSAELWEVLQEISPWKLIDNNHECIIAFYSDCISVVARIDDKVDEIARIPFSNTISSSDILSVSHVISANGLRKDVTFFIPETETLRPKIKLPVARKSVLKRALSYEIERVTPLPITDLYYDYLTDDVSSSPPAADVSVRLVRKSYIDRGIAFCRSAHLSVAEFAFENDTVTAERSAFPVDRQAYFRTIWNRYSFLLTTVTALFLLIVVSIAAYERDSARLKEIDDLVADASPRAERVELLQRRIDATVKELDIATDRKKKHLFIADMKNITDVIPDGAWVSELAQDGNKIKIQGAAPSASILIGAIDKSGYFRNASFDAPVVRDSSNNTERFNISFEVSGEK